MQAYNVAPVEHLAAVLFGLAVLHSFCVKRFQVLAERYPEGSIGENFFHLVGEVEVVFGLWAGIFVLGYAFLASRVQAVQFVDGLNFTEPLFVFAIMAIAATRPVLVLAHALIQWLARALQRLARVPATAAFYFSALTLGPLLGSLITEPAAMTVTALVLKDRFFDGDHPESFKYATLAVLFVNISIGGVLTNFAAPPVVMVAQVWNWDTPFMLANFGIKATAAVVVNAFVTGYFFRNALAKSAQVAATTSPKAVPLWLIAIHLFFLAAVVSTAHHPSFFIGLFLFFLGVVKITAEYQDEVKLKEALLVSFFLAGLVVLGSLQRWWLQPLLASLGPSELYFGATALTAITDNAALTFLGAQVEGLSDTLKYALVAGAVSGGGLTVIANAPNPAGFSILQSSFGSSGISPARLFIAAIPPTLCAITFLWLLP